MNHVDDSRLLAHLDGEVPGDESARIEEHLDGCEPCRERRRAVERRSRLFSEAVGRLDVAPPAVGWEEVRARARSDDPAEERRDRTDGSGSVAGSVESGSSGRRPGPGRVAPVLKAAAVILVVTGVAAAVPGSPVDDWIGAAVDEVAELFGGDEEVTEPAAPAVEEDPDSSSGVAVALAAGRVRVSLEEVPAGTDVRVRLVDGDRAVVEATGARYRTGPGRIEAIGATGSPLQVNIPRMAATARVLVNGEPAVVLEESGLRALLEGAVRSDSSVSFRVRSP